MKAKPNMRVTSCKKKRNVLEELPFVVLTAPVDGE